MNYENNIHAQIIRLFTGEAGPEDKKLIEAWLNQSPENSNLFTELKDIWLSSGIKGNADHYNVEEAVRLFKEKISSEKQAKILRFPVYQIIKYAAIAILILALPISFFIGRQSGPATDSFTTVSCPLGDKSSVVLPDSSRVWLNSGSKLTFSNNFKKGIRQVYLEGEAYFTVTKDKKNPFNVKTSGIEVEVIGTEFNLKAYPDEGQVSTTLINGCVKISSESRQTILKPNQKLIYDKNEGKMALVELDDTAPETEWKDGRLVFRSESLAGLELKLERWFDVDIVFADEEVKQRRFTGILERESILEAISYFGHSRYVGYNIKGNEITFSSKKQP